MIVFAVVLEDFLEMVFADDDNLIEAFAADCCDESFDVWILPRRAWRNGFLLEPKGRRAFGEFRTIGDIAVGQQVFGRCLKREGVNDLLAGPSRRGSRGDGEMEHLPALVRQHHEDKQDAERDCWHGEKANGDELLSVFAEKSSQRLRGWSALALLAVLSDRRG